MTSQEREHKLVHTHERVTKKLPEGYTSKMIYSDTLTIAWPSVVELMLTQLASMVDMMMVGQLGAWAITSVGLTTQPKFMLMAMFVALNAGATAMVSRFKGSEERENANLVLRQSILITFWLALIVGAVGFFFAESLISFMGAAEEATLRGGTQYLQIQLLGFMAVPLTTVASATLRGVGNTRLAMFYNLTANLVNVIFNYLLIGGNFGFPRLGVAGASLATVIGQLVAFVIAYYSLLSGKHYLKLSFKDSYRPDFVMIKRIVNIGLPAMLEQCVMRAGMIMYSKTVASLGTLDFAIHNICMNIQALSFMNGEAFGIAATSLMGQSLGKGRPDLAQTYCRYARRLGMIVSIVLGSIFFFFGGHIASLYSSDPVIIQAAAQILMLLALMQPLQSSQFIIAGALRGAGDTRATAVTTFVCVLLVRPLFAMYAVNVAGWGLLGAWIALVVDQLLRSVLVFSRFNSGKWKKIKV